jgi:hypothetical protein
MAREPLRYDVAMVGTEGKPTERFQRLWQNTVSRLDPEFALVTDTEPSSKGTLVVEATSDTSLTFRYMGSDGVVRSASLTLS